MGSMTAEAPTHLDIDPSLVGELDLGSFEVPYVNLEHAAIAHTHLRVDDTEYVYDRSYPIRGHSAIMPGEVAELLQKGRRVLVAERSERYYLYLA
jgi:hypothetical protein